MKILKWALALSLTVIIAGGVLSALQITTDQRAIQQWQAEVNRLNAQALLLTAQVADLEIQAESDYYRGILSSCVGIGMQMGMPQEAVSLTCSAYWQAAYENDWYTELQLDAWTWPPKKE